MTRRRRNRRRVRPGSESGRSTREKQRERKDAAVVSALQTTIVTGDEVNGSVLSAAHGLGKEGDEPLVWQQEGEVIQIEHHHSQ